MLFMIPHLYYKTYPKCNALYFQFGLCLMCPPADDMFSTIQSMRRKFHAVFTVSMIKLSMLDVLCVEKKIMCFHLQFHNFIRLISTKSAFYVTIKFTR